MQVSRSLGVNEERNSVAMVLGLMFTQCAHANDAQIKRPEWISVATFIDLATGERIEERELRFGDPTDCKSIVDGVGPIPPSDQRALDRGVSGPHLEAGATYASERSPPGEDARPMRRHRGHHRRGLSRITAFHPEARERKGAGTAVRAPRRNWAPRAIFPTPF